MMSKNRVVDEIGAENKIKNELHFDGKKSGMPSAWFIILDFMVLNL